MNETKAIVQTAIANLRSSPTPRAELSSQVLLGYEVKILREEGKWFKVETDDGEIGFIHKGSLVPKEEASSFSSLPKVMVNELYLSLVDPERGHPILRLPMGSLLGLVEEEDDRILVALPSGKKGEVPKGSTKKEPLPPPSAPEEVISLAEKLLGIPYLWGGTSSFGFDCSGFIQFIFRLNGLLLPRNSKDQALFGREIEGDIASLLPADLLFFYEGDYKIGHVALSLGGGEIIHSALSRGGVVRETLIPGKSNFNEGLLHSFAWARRVLF